MTIKISMGHVGTYDERIAAFTRQLGLDSVQLHNPQGLPSKDGSWQIDDLIALRERIEADGLRLEGLENVPVADFFRIQQGLPGAEEQLEAYTDHPESSRGLTPIGRLMLMPLAARRTSARWIAFP